MKARRTRVLFRLHGQKVVGPGFKLSLDICSWVARSGARPIPGRPRVWPDVLGQVWRGRGLLEPCMGRSGAGTGSRPWAPEMGRGQSSNVKVSEWPARDHTNGCD